MGFVGDDRCEEVGSLQGFHMAIFRKSQGKSRAFLAVSPMKFSFIQFELD